MGNITKTLKIPTGIEKGFEFSENRLAIGDCIDRLSYTPVYTAIDVTPKHQALAGMTNRCWSIALAWVAKNQTKGRNESPFDSVSYQRYKPLGNMLNAKLELCYALVELLNEVGVGDALGAMDSTTLWEAAVREEIANDILMKVETKITSKQKVIDFMRQEIKILKGIIGKPGIEHENPYNPATYPINFNLFQAVLMVSRCNPADNNERRSARRIFRTGALKRFVDTYEIWVSTITRNPEFGTYWVENGKLCTSEKKEKKKSGKKIVA